MCNVANADYQPWEILHIMATDTAFRMKYKNELKFSARQLYCKAKDWRHEKREFTYNDVYKPYNPLKLSQNLNGLNCKSLDLQYQGLLIKNHEKVKPIPMKVVEISPNSMRLNIVPMLPNKVWKYCQNNNNKYNNKNNKNNIDIHNARSYLIIKFVDKLTTVQNMPYNGYHFEYGSPTRLQIYTIMEKGINIAGIHYSMLFYSLKNLYQREIIMIAKDLLPFPEVGWNN